MFKRPHLIPVYITCLALGIAVFLVSPVWAGGHKDKCQAPYFYIEDGDPDLDRLPLTGARAKVKISGFLARVKVIQEYHNQGKRPLEAVYLFPASTKASVHNLTMTIGQRTIKARIRKTEQARREFGQARQQGKSASLLEQKRPNVFQMRVTNIMPGDHIRVEMDYTEILKPADKVYEFVFPTVVGPRYRSEDQGVEADTWVANPYLPRGEQSLHSFGLELELTSPIAVSRLGCPSHNPKITYEDSHRAKVVLEPSPQAGNRDFVLRYTLAGNQIQTGFLTQKTLQGNHFLLMIEPPLEEIRAEVLPREFIFVVDVSGSMRGFPLTCAIRLMKNLMTGLSEKDSFNILFFAGGDRLLSPVSLKASPENKKRALAMLEKVKGGGGTRLLPALERALKLPEQEESSRILVLITDGYVHVEQKALALVKNNLGRANLFTMGVGSSVNRYLVEALARAGQGEAMVILNPDQAGKGAERFARYISRPVLKDIKIEFTGISASELEPGRLPDLFDQRPLSVLGKFKGETPAKVKITGRTAKGPYTKVIELKASDLDKSKGSLDLLWAKKRIQGLNDLLSVSDPSELKEEITGLGLKYNLLTAFTSFVAVDEKIRAKGEKPEVVVQPLPLPRGVENSAVGPSPAMARGKAFLSAARAPRPMVLTQPAPEPATGIVGNFRLGFVQAGDQQNRRKVENLLRRKWNLLASCLGHSLQNKITGSEKWVVTFTVNRKGKAEIIQLENRSKNISIVLSCATAFLKKLLFPALNPRARYEVKFLINLN
ncbi:VIT domain-containing protein [Dethiosulfatarculus sandiegensis]|uniref:Trypsin n=1 Tax=Dethiosulfatarculus sandiegensis TaxID=1429043 RepID=A0A0D2HKJ3_9BACT|nr:VIT domain-containing protein [Dethiosulfatarculus sandiegensis]KIX11168.1 trypsin [Dethiosulfatarculus sandiegensis]